MATGLSMEETGDLTEEKEHRELVLWGHYARIGVYVHHKLCRRQTVCGEPFSGTKGVRLRVGVTCRCPHIGLIAICSLFTSAGVAGVSEVLTAGRDLLHLSVCFLALGHGCLFSLPVLFPEISCY